MNAERDRLAGLESRKAALTAEFAGRRHGHAEGETRLRLAAQAGRLGFWELDLRTRELTASAMCKENFGRNRSDPFTYEELKQALHPDDRERMAAAVQDSASTGADYDIEYRVVRPDGKTGWLQVRAQVVRAEDGTPSRMAGISLDITERRSAELRLELSEESLRLATDAAEVGTWDLDLTTDVLTWSDRTKAMFGISPDVPCSMADFYAGLHPDDRDATSLGFASALDPTRRATYDVEYRTIGKEDGLVRWVAAKGKGLFNGHGRCVRAIGTAIDVTARKVAGARQTFLLELEDQLRALSEPPAIMLAAVGALGRHLRAGRAGYGQVQPDDATIVLESSYADGLAPLTGTFALAAFGSANVARQRQGLTVVCDDVTADPSQDPAIWTAIDTRSFASVPLVRDGRFRASLYVNYQGARAWPAEDVALLEEVAARIWDTVERARAEVALREANETLEQRIAAALAERETIEEQLRQAQKMEAVGQLTGGIAHDFNNLLQIVVGNLEILQRGLPEDAGRLRRSADHAMTGAKRASTLTQRLLAFSRRQPLAPKPVEANALVSGMSDLLNRALGETIEIETVLAGGLWRTEADPNQLESAILNLAVNARDAMPEGGKLTIETANARLDEAYAQSNLEVRPGQYVAISVSDAGSGMDKSTMARVFEPFFTTKQVGKGTGLGLAMVYGFIKQSGGHVKLYSEPGQGTTVKIYLPRLAGGVEQDKAVPVPAIPEAAPTETILVVEDDDDVRAYSAEVLRELGYRVLEANDGPSALAALGRPGGADVRLLFTDVVLPGGLSGADLARTATALRPGLRVLFTTGYARNAIVHQGRLDEGVELIIKPFTYADLAAKVRDVLDTSSITQIEQKARETVDSGPGRL